MDSSEQLRTIGQEDIIGLPPLEVDAYMTIGGNAVKRQVRLGPDGVTIKSSEDGGPDYASFTLDDESVPEDERRSIVLPVNKPAVRQEVYGESSFLDGRLVIHYNQRVLTIDGTTTELTDKEFSLLKHLVVNKGVIQTRNQLLESIWGDTEFRATSTVAVHVNRVRKKLGGLNWTVQTIRRWGYMFNDSLPLSSGVVSYDAT
ncbi:MAG: winged helix-turn-helix domain-containing protein [Candidatus Saccharibacteria bacterium]